jgi:hypothetical protein
VSSSLGEEYAKEFPLRPLIIWEPTQPDVPLSTLCLFVNQLIKMYTDAAEHELYDFCKELGITSDIIFEMIIDVECLEESSMTIWFKDRIVLKYQNFEWTMIEASD